MCYTYVIKTNDRGWGLVVYKNKMKIIKQFKDACKENSMVWVLKMKHRPDQQLSGYSISHKAKGLGFHSRSRARTLVAGRGTCRKQPIDMSLSQINGRKMPQGRINRERKWTTHFFIDKFPLLLQFFTPHLPFFSNFQQTQPFLPQSQHSCEQTYDVIICECGSQVSEDLS